MDLSGKQILNLKIEKVWDALNDPEVLQQTIPGCLSIESLSATEMQATVQTKIGPINTKFKGKISISDIKLFKSYKISGKGNGAAGFASGSANILFETTDEGTLLTYEVDANVGGKLAQIGSRLIKSTAKKLADEFFENLANSLNEANSLDKERPITQEPAVKSPSPSSSESKLKIPQMIWITLISGFSIYSLWYFSS